MKAKLMGIFLLLFLPLLALVGIASAQTFRTGNTATVGKGEVIDSTLWASGQNVNIAGEVNGDVFCAGQTVSISGTVHGDVICAAQTISVSGTVAGDIRAAAQTVTVSSGIEGNLTVAGQTVTLESRSKVSDASIASQDANVSGIITRDLALAAHSATVSGNVGRNIKANVENLTLTGSAQIGGSINYTSANEAQIAEGAKVAGETTRSEPARPDKGSDFGFKFFGSLALLLTALILALLFPRMFHKVTDQAVASWGKTLLVGFMSSIIAPVLIIVALITVFGIPLAILATIAWLLVLALSGVFAAYYLGRLAWRSQNNAVVTMGVGAIILLLVRFIPVVGFIVSIFAMWFGIGMILLALRERTPKPSYDTKNLK
ncbi:MAG TPA: hypothetical protein VFX86_04335 [Candidatus Saccharimonadales bacterium]|nr:hypothetical protein [Candidatus Saccharimonadales bacterium]